MIRTFRFPLLPNKAQEAALETYVWRCRQLYNAALEQRINAYKKQGRTLTKFDQQKELTDLRLADPDFKAVPTTILRSALDRLDKAYKSFFRRVKAGKEKPGFPRFKGRDRYKSFNFQRAPEIIENRVTVPLLGPVKFKRYREIKGTPLDAIVSYDSTGKWWLSVQCDLGQAPEKINPVLSTGVDVGLSSFLTLSTGEKVENPRFFRKAEKLLAERQRKLALKKRGSNSKLQAKRLVAKIHARVKNQRRDFVRKLVNTLFSRFDLIAYEDLNIRGLVKGNLSKSINDVAWGLFTHALTCKAEEAGKWAVGVDPKNTSQRCSRCQRLPLVKKSLSDREHRCDRGLVLDRDYNAALNILTLGLSALENGCEIV